MVRAMSERPTHAEVVERLLLYVEAALQVARDEGDRETASRLSAIHAELLRDGFKAAPEGALF